MCMNQELEWRTPRGKLQNVQKVEVFTGCQYIGWLMQINGDINGVRNGTYVHENLVGLWSGIIINC